MADNPQEKLSEQHDRHIAADADTHVGPKSSKDQLEIERLRLEIEQLRATTNNAKNRSWWLSREVLLPVLFGVGSFVVAQVHWFQANILSGEANRKEQQAANKVEKAKITLGWAQLEKDKAEFMKQKLTEENDDLKAKLEVTKRQMSEKIQSAEVKLKAYEKKGEVLLKDLSVASRLTTQGARILISRDNSDVPQVTGIDLGGIDLTPIENDEGKDQAIDGFVNGLRELSHFHALIPPRPFDERLVAHLRVLRHLHLDISSLELDADALKLLAQMPNLTGVGIRVHQLKSLKSFPHLSEFSIAMSDPFGNMILTPELGPFEDGSFPNTERLIFADLIQELAPLMKLPNLRDLEIGKAWSGVGYRVTDDDLTALRRLTKLRTLVIHANYNSPEERERIAEALPKCRVKFSE